MPTHYCINCPRCHRGCSLCGRCACTPADLEEMFKPFQLPQLEPLPTFEPVEDPSKPETD